MKVSSRGGERSGCMVWGPRAALPPGLPAAACGLRRPGRPGGRACVPGKMRGGPVVAAPRAQAARSPGRPRGRGAAPAASGPGGLGKFPHYRCQLTKALMSPCAPSPAKTGWGGGVAGLGFALQPEPSLRAALFDFQRAGEASLTC